MSQEKGDEDLRNYGEWLNNVPKEYAFMEQILLPDQSLCVEWLPDGNMIVGRYPPPTKSTGSREDDEPCVWVIDPVKYKDTDKKVDSSLYSHGTTAEVNRARVYTHKPTGKTYFATISGNGDIYVFDYEKIMEDPSVDPITISFHTHNAFGLAWSPEGILAAGCDAGEISTWKVDFTNMAANKLSSIKLIETYQGEPNGVNEVLWRDNITLLAACEDGRVRIYDKFLNEKGSWVTHSQSVNCLALNPLNTELVATAGSDSSGSAIKLWMFDSFSGYKNPKALGTIKDKTIGSVSSLKFNPAIDGVLAGGDDKCHVYLWNINNVGKQPVNRGGIKVPAAVLFAHLGHYCEVNDIAWYPSEDKKKGVILASSGLEQRIHLFAPFELTELGT